MSKKQNNQIEAVNMEELENAGETEMAVETKEGLGSKVKNGIKKHGKKILTGVGIAVGGAILYGLGKKSGTSYTTIEEDTDIYDLDVYESEPEDTYVAE